MINEKKCMSTFLISKIDICLAGHFFCKVQFSLFPQIGFTLTKSFDISSIFKDNFEIYLVFSTNGHINWVVTNCWGNAM